MKKSFRIAAASAAALAATLVLGAGTAEAATPAAGSIVLADTSTNTGLGAEIGDVADSLGTLAYNVLTGLGVSL